MKTIREIKDIISRGTGDMTVADVFGINQIEWLEIEARMASEVGERDGRIEEAIMVMEKVLKVKGYSSESLLRLVIMLEAFKRANRVPPSILSG